MTRGATHRFIPNPLTADSTGKISGTVVLNKDTGNEVALTLDYTTNKLTSGNDTGVLVNMTDTASPGTSLLQDWQVGGVSQTFMKNNGSMQISNTLQISMQGLNIINSSSVAYPIIILAPTVNCPVLTLRGASASQVTPLLQWAKTGTSYLGVIDEDGDFGIGTVTPNANAILDVTSTTKAFMPPRMTETQRNAIASPTEGMLIFNLTTHVLNYYGAAAWAAV